MKRLGINAGKYSGEGIDIRRVIGEMERAAGEFGWVSETFLEADACRLLAFSRRMPAAAKRVYVSAGIHGDEPAGPLALLQLVQENRWPANVDVWLCPCLNPTGFPLNQRENYQGLDLNRQYLQPESEEIARISPGWRSSRLST